MKHLFFIFLLFALKAASQTAFPLYVPSNPDSIKHIVNVNGSPRVAYNIDLMKKKLNIADTANIRLRALAGTNMTITGTYPNLTFNASASGGGSISRTSRGDSLTVGTTTVADKDNPLNDPYYLASNLKATQSKFYSAATNAGNLNIVLWGDSKTAFNNILEGNFKTLLGKYNLSGVGYVTPDLSTYQVSTTANPTANNWTKLDGYSTPTGKSIDGYSLQSTASSTDFNWYIFQPGTGNFTDLDIFWYGKTGGGTFTVTCLGQTVTINTSSATGFQKTTLSGISGGSVNHIVTVHQTSYSTAGCEILGFNGYFSAVPGIKVHKAGQQGFTSGSYVGIDSALQVSELSALSPDLLVIYLGTNDRRANITPAAYKANMKTLVRRAKSMTSKPDIVLVASEGYSIVWGGQTYSEFDYAEQLRQIAIEDTVAFFDNNKLFGAYPYPVSWNVLGDNLHETTSAGNAIAAGILKPISGTLNPDQVNKSFYTSDGTMTGNRTINAANNQIIVDSLQFWDFKFNGGGLRITPTSSSATISSIVANKTLTFSGWSAINFGNGGAIDNTFSGANFGQLTATMTSNTGLPLIVKNNNSTTAYVGSFQMPNLPTSNYSTLQIGKSFTDYLGINYWYAGAGFNVGNNLYFGHPLYKGFKVFMDGRSLLGASISSTISSNAAIEEIVSTTRGVLLPRMTTAQRDALNKGVASVTINAGGTGYTSAPGLLFSSSAGEVVAIGTATISGGAVTGVTINYAGSYSATVPTITFSGGGGTGASATAVLGSATTPPEGLEIYNLDTHTKQYYNGTVWKNVLTD